MKNKEIKKTYRIKKIYSKTVIYVITIICIMTMVGVFDFVVPENNISSYAVADAGTENTNTNESSSEQEQNQQPSEQDVPAQQSEENNQEEVSQTETKQLSETASFANDAVALKQTLEQNGSTVTLNSNGDALDSITMVDVNKGMIILSNANPELYQNATINFNATGEVSTIGTVNLNDQNLTYQGLGSNEYPFNGELDQADKISLDRPLFNAIKLKKDVTYRYNLKWNATETKEGMFASYIEGNESTLTVDSEFVKDKDNNKQYTINSPVLGSLKGDLNLTAKYSCSDSADNSDSNITKAINIISSKDSGLLVNELLEGDLTVNGVTGIVFENISNITVEALDGNAGLLVGQLCTNTSLEIIPTIEIPSVDGVSSNITAKASAGGLVGLADDGSSVSISDNVSLEGLKVYGDIAGGFVGTANDMKLTVGADKTVTPAASVGAIEKKLNNDETVSSQYAGGFFGVYEKTTNVQLPIVQFDLSNEIKLTAKTDEGVAGGIFGLAEIGADKSITIDGGETTGQVKTSLNSNASVRSYGGIFGQVTGTGTTSVIKVSNYNVTANSEGAAVYKAGIVGIQGDFDENDTIEATTDKPNTLVVEDVTTSIKNPATSDVNEYGFGGISGRLCDGSVLDVKDVTIETQNGNINSGGAVLGFAGRGSAVRFRGVTNVSKVSYGTGNNIGQLIGGQDCALIYAHGSGSNAEDATDGWRYIRNIGTKYDDIGNYGQVYRVWSEGLSGDLITMNSDYAVTLSQADYNGEITISDKNDLARLAITLQTKGYFSGDADVVTSTNWNTMLAKNINLNNNITLSGTGVTGITRDSDYGDMPAYTGTFNGSGHTITLAVGEAYGMKKPLISPITTVDAGDAGNGIVYRHNRLGLFNTSNGSAKNLTIDGNILFEAAVDGIAAGGYSACSNGGDKTFDACTFEPNVTYKTEEKMCYVGGVMGMLDEVTVNKTTFTGGTKIAPTIKINAATSQGVDITGGAIGYISGKCPAEVYADNLTLGANISNENNTYTNSLAGGYIGVIQPSEILSNKRVREKNAKVEFKNTIMNGHRVELMSEKSTGGLLGYMWSDTDVTFVETVDGEGSKYGLSVNDTTSLKTELNANTSEAGGLVYRAAGKWTIGNSGINLAGAKFSSINNIFGLLVCQGATGKERINATKYQVDKKQFNVNSGALYLEVTDKWDVAYPISESSININCTPSSFDEFVAVTMSGKGSFANDVSGVVSLRTTDNDDNKKVIMNGNDINTYINRTSYGKAHKTNAMTRYYYNLDSAIESMKMGGKANNSVIDTPEELLVWSVNMYAGTNIKEYFNKYDAKLTDDKTKIGSENDSIVKLDLNGYSYYPVTINNRNIDISNAEIKFHNDSIETSEGKEGNKITRDYTQHYAMHCGLFRDFTTRETDKDNQGDYSIECNNVTATGTVGFYSSDSSGALISGVVKGFTYQGEPSIYSIKIYNSSLNNLKVKGFKSGIISDDSAPLLIKSSDSFSEIFITDFEVDNDCRASSLIGDVGKIEDDGTSDSTQVTINFSKISVPSSDETVFSRASLLNSFVYNKNGGVASAVYNFSKADNKVTFGREIDGTKEYPGRQLWFYDADTYETDRGLVTDGSVTANGTDPQFGSYLPYVWKGFNESDPYHEMKINHMSADIIEGCGTYFDPYVISNERQLTTVAGFINNRNAGSGLKITISKDLTKACGRLKDDDNSEDNHVTYIFEGNIWRTESGDKSINNDTMHRYMQSAYYDIQNDLTLEDFDGLGNPTYPFRGVITSAGGEAKTITLTNSTGLQGFIPCSYGSVIKNINFEYKNDNTLTYKEMSDADVSPNTYFGGVIGLILGGDNIIDNVKVSFDTEGEDAFHLSSSDTAEDHLVPIGGYIGAISGGGVIFRNMKSTDSYKGFIDSNSGCLLNGLSSADTAYQSLYVNPIVGRVISGYAFSENCTVSNNDKNYKINMLKPEGETHGIKSEVVKNTTPIKTTINSSQGLLVFSAIIQSGAGAGHINDGSTDTNSNLQGTKPYLGSNKEYEGYCFGNDGLGKVRNARYDYIGNPNISGSLDDFESSVRDDTYAPGLSDKTYKKESIVGSHGNGFVELNDPTQYVNSPYLVRNYATPQTEFVCASNISLMSLRFKDNEVIDVAQYGNAYTGLTGRFKSNAVAANQSESASVDRVIPYVIDIRGNNATLKVSNTIREYADDDYHTPGAGALFSTLYWGYNVKNGNESLRENNYCLAKDLNIVDSTITIEYYDADGNPVTNTSQEAYSYGAGGGGLFGNIAYIHNNYNVALFKNINVSGTNISGFKASGSIAGSMGSKNKGIKKHTIGAEGESMMSYELIDCTYDNCTIEAKEYAGGFVGRGYGYIDANKSLYPYNGITVTKEGIVTGKNTKIVTEQSSGGYAGGIVGSQQGRLGVNYPDYKAIKSDGTVYYECPNKLEEAKFENINIQTENGYAGGVAGDIAPNSSNYNDTAVYNVSVTSVKGVGKEDTTIQGSYIGGIIGRNQDKKYTNDIFDDCHVSSVTFKPQAHYYNGGIIGHVGKPGSTGSVVSILNSSVKECVFNNPSYRGGGVVGNIESATQNMVLRNIASVGNTFKGQNSAGLINISRGNVQGCNILIADNKFIGTGTERGLLVSWNHTGTLRFAGLSVKRNKDDNLNVLNGKGSTEGSYFAFADYKNTSANGLSEDDKEKALLDVNKEWPYVTTSPISGYTVKDTAAGDPKYLFGDSIGSISDGNPVTTAKTIMDEINTNDHPTRYKYSKVTGNKFDFKQISTFNKNNESTKIPADKPDIPVLLVSGGDTAGIEKYLDIVTNGGYTDAKNQNGDVQHVTAEVTTYKWNGESFVKSNDNPSLVVRNNGSRNMSFSSTTEYDNDRGRLSMLTVKFQEAGGEYRVSVPIIVRRVLEVNFTATLNYGTVFNKDEYANLGEDAHILESFGNPVTALLTFKYNSAYNEATEYGWDTYLAAGGEMTAVDKEIVFDNSSGDGIPAGTMLSLVDCVDNKVYTATFPGGNRISLSSFKDTKGNSYKNKWISELMGVKASSASDGIWVECDDTDVAHATAMEKDGKKYRLAGENDRDKTKYNLTVAKTSNGKEIQPEESFYLVINVPYNDATKDLSANGNISTQLESGSIPNNVNYTLRTDSGRDNHQNTASTYSFLSGYTQELYDRTPDKDSAVNEKLQPVKKSGTAGSYININVVDRISFNKDQNYNDSDKLYYKLDTSLQQYENKALSTTNNFATGTEGTVYFYVYTGSVDNPTTYYSYNNGQWNSSNSEVPVTSYDWTATADNNGAMSLVLKNDDVPISLSGIRQICKDSGISTFYIKTSIKVHMSDAAEKASIQGSNQYGADNYTKLYYKGTLAVREESLSYSSTSEKRDGIVGYYRGGAGVSRISYSANDIQQLGINCSELDTADGNITTTGIYTLDDLVNANDKIEMADRIVYTLRLERRTGTNGSYVAVDNPKEYITVSCDQLGEATIIEPGATTPGTFQWTDTKSPGGKFNSMEGSKRFQVTLQVRVKTDNVESASHFYSNYRLRLTAEMYDGNNRIDYPVNNRATGATEITDLYSHSDYVTYTLTRINVDGIVMQQK